MAAEENHHAARFAYEVVGEYLKKQRQLGFDEVRLRSIAGQTGLDVATVETALGKIERREPDRVKRTGGSGDEVTWEILGA